LDSKDEEIFAMLDLIFALQTSKIRRQWHPTWWRWRNLHTTCAVEGV
jgi:hypothetical protein